MEGEIADTPIGPTGVGERLRAAREAMGVDISEIAARTRIPQRHLEAIESSDFTGLPSITYAMGFAKAYARAVGADEVAIARDLRRELGDNPERAAPTPSYEMEDPTRVPPRGIMWAGVVIALLLIVGVGLWYGTSWFRGSPPPPEGLVTAEPSPAAAAPDNSAAPTAAPVAGGQVTLVALDTVWLRVTDAAGKRLFEKEMAAGERYDVPADAASPKLRTGRPDRLQVLVNGSQVAPLGTGVETVNVEVSAAALQARGQPAAAGSPAASPPAPARATSAAQRLDPRPAAAPTPAAPVETPAGNATATP